MSRCEMTNNSEMTIIIVNYNMYIINSLYTLFYESPVADNQFPTNYPQKKVIIIFFSFSERGNIFSYTKVCRQ